MGRCRLLVLDVLLMRRLGWWLMDRGRPLVLDVLLIRRRRRLLMDRRLLVPLVRNRGRLERRSDLEGIVREACDGARFSCSEISFARSPAGTTTEARFPCRDVRIGTACVFAWARLTR